MNRMKNSLSIRIREFLNPYLGLFRRIKLNNKHFTIISNNCWGGHVYRYFNCPYLSPTVGLYFFAEDYIKFVGNLKHYLNTPISFISCDKSKHSEVLKERFKTGHLCPIGIIDDVEIVFLHYHSEEEVLKKWYRRIERMNWDNIVVKMSEQNGCKFEHILAFDNLPYDRKFIFVSEDYGVKSQVVMKEYNGLKETPDDTTHFRRYVNLVNFLNGKPFKKRQE